MICINCQSESATTFFVERFPCHHCSDENTIEYNACPECGWLWRSVNNVPMDDSQIHMGDESTFDNIFVADAVGPFEHDNLTDEEKKIMDNIAQHMEQISKIDVGEASMSDHLHRCLQCNSTAVDVVDGKYTCTDCTFSWEVVKFD